MEDKYKSITIVGYGQKLHMGIGHVNWGVTTKSPSIMEP